MFANNSRLWLARILIGLVTMWNLQAAMTFILWPNSYVASYELSGIAGEAALRGVGVLFLMWNVPYVVALWHPIRYRLALILTLVMQSIGLVGENLILSTLSTNHGFLRASIMRFIVFDSAGLILLIIAFLIKRREKNL